MYKSILIPAGDEHAIYHMLSNEENVHRSVMAFFDKGRSEEKVLYRMFKAPSGNQFHICVQSQNKPIVKETPFLSCVMSKSADEVKAGDVLPFRILARPCKQAPNSGNYKILIKGAEARIKWLKEKFSRSGGEILDIQDVDSQETIVIHKGQKPTKFVGREYTGSLQIKDPEKFMKLYTEGLGHGKSYGFGMLMLG